MKLTGLNFLLLVCYKTVCVHWWSRSFDSGGSYSLWRTLPDGGTNTAHTYQPYGVARDHFCGRGVPVSTVTVFG